MALEAKRQQKTKQKHKPVSHFYFYFCQKMEFRTYFAYFHTCSYNSKSNELPQSLGRLRITEYVPESPLFLIFPASYFTQKKHLRELPVVLNSYHSQ